MITVIPTPQMKFAHTAAFVTFLLNKPYMNGARNEPARAPQEYPISCAMNVGGFKAITTEITMKNTIKMRIVKSVFFSFDFFMQVILRKSSVNVELDVSTSDESVDMEAERTRTTTTPIKISGRVESICGTMLS